MSHDTWTSEIASFWGGAIRIHKSRVVAGAMRRRRRVCFLGTPPALLNSKMQSHFDCAPPAALVPPSTRTLPAWTASTALGAETSVLELHMWISHPPSKAPRKFLEVQGANLHHHASLHRIRLDCGIELLIYTALLDFFFSISPKFDHFFLIIALVLQLIWKLGIDHKLRALT